ncbi:MAG TPA: WD40 repeat domain-containing protein [Pirellulaceae bacterium]|nr:WD40 repeat domain-containing protein [Pirellulaceae bacterium]HMP71033.1 WD40 repeat domain-containing protein [Pirellulaceae bacterium]
MLVTVATACASGQTTTLNIEKRSVVRISDDQLVSLTISPSGEAVAVAGVDGSLTLLDASLHQRARVDLAHSTPINSVCFISEASLVSCDKMGLVREWSSLGLNLRREVLRTGVKSIKPGGSRANGAIVTSSNEGIQIQFSDNSTCDLSIKHPHSFALKVDDQSKQAIVGTWGGLLMVAELEKADELQVVDLEELAGGRLPEYLVGLSFNISGDRLAVLAENDGRIWVAIVNMPEVKVFHVLEESKRGPLLGIAFLSDSMVCAFGRDVVFWDADTGEEIGRIKQPEVAVGPPPPYYSDLCTVTGLDEGEHVIFLSTTGGTIEKYSLSRRQNGS